MAKLTLTNIVSGYAGTTQYNANNTLVEAALENTLSRDGTTPNQMEANIDMNSNRVINLAAPQNGNDAARYTDVSEVLNVTDLAAPVLAGNSGRMLGTDGVSTFWREADNLNYNPVGAPNLVATDVDAALDELDNEKAGVALANTFSGINTFSAKNVFSSVQTGTKGVARTDLATVENIQDNVTDYAVSAGTDTYTATLSPAITALVTGKIYNIFIGNTNTVTNPTLNINGIGATNIVLTDNTALKIGDMLGAHQFFYDGTSLRLLNPVLRNFGSQIVNTYTWSNISTLSVTAGSLSTQGSVVTTDAVEVGDIIMVHLNTGAPTVTTTGGAGIGVSLSGSGSEGIARCGEGAQVDMWTAYSSFYFSTTFPFSTNHYSMWEVVTAGTGIAIDVSLRSTNIACSFAVDDVQLRIIHLR